MPKKIRELKAMLRKAGFSFRPAKGSHTYWNHPLLSETFSLAGGDGDDAKRYQEKQVKILLKKVREVNHE